METSMFVLLLDREVVEIDPVGLSNPALFHQFLHQIV